MCGICGFIEVNGGGNADKESLKDMADTIIHRGPDDEGLYSDGIASLANRRLSIIDLKSGKQPIFNEDGNICVVFNGEIYNHAEISNDLAKKGHRFTTNTDTEVLVHLYEEYGDEIVDHLNGMFAFALWDRRHRRGIIARDRLGIKPLYYSFLNGVLIFGSEIKAILAHPHIASELDTANLNLYLALRYLPEDATIFSQIRKLPPGSFLHIDVGKGEVRSRQYWSPNLIGDEAESMPTDQIAEEIRALLKNSVEIRMMSDVPFGAFLSGGLDSSAMVGLMSQAMSAPVKTFSIGFSEESRLDEISHARTVSNYFATEHREVDCTADKVEMLPKLLSHFDEPFADPVIVPTYQVAELASQHVKVVLTGEGADELFGGYSRFINDENVRNFTKLPNWLGNTAKTFARLLPSKSMREQAGRFFEMGQLDEARRFFQWVSAFNDQDLSELFLVEDRLGTASAVEIYKGHMAALSHAHATNRMIYCDMKIRLPECMLARTDRMTMAVSLEGRTPFLDHRLVERVLGLPHHFKVRGRQEKFILKKALASVLPTSIIQRRKQGLAVPFAQWARYGIEAPMRRILSKENIKRRGLFNPSYIGGLLDNWGPHAARHSQLIWSLLCFELWCLIYLDQTLDPDTPLSQVA